MTLNSTFERVPDENNNHPSIKHLSKGKAKTKKIEVLISDSTIIDDGAQVQDRILANIRDAEEAIRHYAAADKENQNNHNSQAQLIRRITGEEEYWDTAFNEYKQTPLCFNAHNISQSSSKGGNSQAIAGAMRAL